MHPVFFEIHSGLPREAPGSDASTRRALELVPDLPTPARVLDVGCGPGAQTLELAREIDGHVTAVDNHAPYLEEVRRRAEAAGFGERIEARAGDMAALGFDRGSFDLIWSEGAIYIIGFGAGLAAWRDLLAPGGAVAVTEATWLRPDAPAECREFWDAAYPAMTDVAGNLATAQDTGYRVLGQFTLPESDWWDAYYLPLEARMEALRRLHADDADAVAAIDEERAEIDFYRRFAAWYGYVFYVLERND